MAIPLVVPNACLIRLLWSYGGQLAINVLGGQKLVGAVINQATAETLGTAIKSNFTTAIGSRTHTTTQLVRVGIRDISAPNLPEYRDTGAAVAGTGTGDPIPRGVAVCVTLRTAASGRSYMGRTYYGGFTETDNDATGSTAAALSTAVVTFAQLINQALASVQISGAVVSRPSERVTVVQTTFHADGTTSTETLSDQKARAGTSTVITAFEARNTRWEYQRRRDNGRGAGGVALLNPVASVPARPA